MSEAIRKIQVIEEKALEGIKHFQGVLSATALLKEELSGGSDSSISKATITGSSIVSKRMKRLKK